MTQGSRCNEADHSYDNSNKVVILEQVLVKRYKTKV